MLSCEVRNIIIRDLFDKSVSYLIKIETFFIDKEYPTALYKHKPSIKENITDSEVLHIPSNNYIWIVLAKRSATKSNCHLVNIRWPSNLSKDKWDNCLSRRLYNETIQLVSRNGLDATRKSGSYRPTT